ncbi:MAG: DNA polymerase III subunit delta [Candidatus Riflebacteria bacterium]|nr:DNA polymerase III subunit delta [Candidatus Riflebacteria bacterium]
MDIPTFEVLLKKRGLTKRLFVFAGREDFLKERMCEKIAETLVNSDERSENVFRFDFSKNDSDDFFSKLDGFCFSSDPRLFFFSNFDSLSTTNRKKIYSTITSSYFPQDIFLVLMISNQPISMEATRALGELSEKLDFWAPFANQFPSWVQKTAGEFEARITPGACNLLIQKIGENLRLIFQEVKKLALSAGKGGIISEKMVETGVSYLKEDNIFDLLTAIGKRELSSSLKIMENLYSRGEPIQKTWFMIQKTLRDFRLFHDLSFDRPDLFGEISTSMKRLLSIHGKTDFKANQERKNIISEIQGSTMSFPDLIREVFSMENPNVVSNLSLALNFSHSELRDLWPRLLEMDASMKTSIPSQILAIQEFLIEVINPKLRKQSLYQVKN